MAVLTATLVLQGQDSKAIIRTYFATETVASTNNDWNVLDITLLNDFSEAYLQNIDLMIRAAATRHDATDEETLDLQLRRDGVMLHRYTPSNRLRSANVNGNATTVNAELISLNNPIPHVLLPGDVIRFNLPPADDHASAATGIYELILVMFILKK